MDEFGAMKSSTPKRSWAPVAVARDGSDHRMTQYLPVFAWLTAHEGHAQCMPLGRNNDYVHICFDRRCRVKYRSSFFASVPENGIRMVVEGIGHQR